MSSKTGYRLDWETAEERIRAHKEFLLNAPQVMDPERMKFMMEIYDKYRGESIYYIRAKLFERVLEKKQIFLDGNPIVGTLTGLRAGVYPYPEWTVGWLKDEIDLAKFSSLGEIKIPEETQILLKDVYKFWKGRTLVDKTNQMYKEFYGSDPLPLFKSGLLFDGCSNASGSGVCDYPRVLNEGLTSIIQEAEDRLRKCRHDANDYDKAEFYRAAIISLKSLITYAHRYADLAEETAAHEDNEAKRDELLEIAEVCRRVPEFPARNFREAIQSFWFIHLGIDIEQMGCATSPGRYGQYMYPFYKKDIDSGMLTRQQVLTLLKFQWIKHLEMASYQGNAYALALSGHTGQTITIGGLDENGDDASTELEEVLMDCQIAMRNIQPTLSLFFHPKLKESYLRKVIDVIRDGSGQPQFMNNAVVIQRHMNRFSECGITLEDARNCGGFGCVGTGVCGKGSFITLEDHPNLAKIIELMLNNGRDPISKKQVTPPFGNPDECTSFEQIYELFCKYLDCTFEMMRRHSNLGNENRAKIAPNIFRSCMIDGCLESGRCEELGGPRYAQSMTITTGGIDAANSLLAIKHLVFDTKSLTMQQLKDALAANFEGHEDIQKLCFDAPKHGNDNEAIDLFVRRMYRDIDKIYRKFGPDFLGHTPHMDAYSLSFHNYFGSLMGALPTGRKARIALTDGSVSAMPGTDKEGATALVKSAAQAIDTVRYTSNHMNFKFLPSTLEGPAGMRTLLALVRTYFDLGGSHIQFNCVSQETLMDAQEHPENHKNLVVRVAGFSAYFTRLDRGVQNEIIKRTSYGSNNV